MDKKIAARVSRASANTIDIPILRKSETASTTTAATSVSQEHIRKGLTTNEDAQFLNNWANGLKIYGIVSSAIILLVGIIVCGSIAFNSNSLYGLMRSSPNQWYILLGSVVSAVYNYVLFRCISVCLSSWASVVQQTWNSVELGVTQVQLLSQLCAKQSACASPANK